jgi:hypothetical protein
MIEIFLNIQLGFCFLYYFISILICLITINAQAHSTTFKPLSFLESDKLCVTTQITIDKETAERFQKKINETTDTTIYIYNTLHKKFTEHSQKQIRIDTTTTEQNILRKNVEVYEIGLAMWNTILKTQNNPSLSTHEKLLYKMATFEKACVIFSFYAALFYKTENPEYAQIAEILYFLQDIALKGGQLFSSNFVVAKFFSTSFFLSSTNDFYFAPRQATGMSGVRTFLLFLNKTQEILSQNTDLDLNLDSYRAETAEIQKVIEPFVTQMSSNTLTFNYSRLMNDITVSEKY